MCASPRATSVSSSTASRSEYSVVRGLTDCSSTRRASEPACREHAGCSSGACACVCAVHTVHVCAPRPTQQQASGEPHLCWGRAPAGQSPVRLSACIHIHSSARCRGCGAAGWQTQHVVPIVPHVVLKWFARVSEHTQRHARVCSAPLHFTHTHWRSFSMAAASRRRTHPHSPEPSGDPRDGRGRSQHHGVTAVPPMNENE